VKHGRTRSFAEFCAVYAADPFSRHVFDPLRVLREYSSYFGRDSVTVYRYDEIMRDRKDVAQHFMTEILGIQSFAKLDTELHNVRLSIAAAELIRRLNAAGLDGTRLLINDPEIRPLLMETTQRSSAFVGSVPLSYNQFLFGYMEKQLVEQWADRIVGFDPSQPLFTERVHVAEYLRNDIWTEMPSLNQAFLQYVQRKKASVQPVFGRASSR
jgi:hypothetical protein